jgi:hypothetical protein
MAIIKKLGINAIITALLIIGLVFVVLATNNFQKMSSGSKTSGINDSKSQCIEIPDLGSQKFDDLKKNPNVLATKGRYPNFATQAEKEEWLVKLDKTFSNLRDDMDTYRYSKGPVVGYGFTPYGYFEVAFYKDVTDSQINEIYNLIDKSASEASIQEIPVVFLKGHYVQCDAVTGDAGAVEKAANLSTGNSST